jgi:hypothetical protein
MQIETASRPKGQRSRNGTFLAQAQKNERGHVADEGKFQAAMDGWIWTGFQKRRQNSKNNGGETGKFGKTKLNAGIMKRK